MATTNDLKNGLVLNLDGQLWTVVEFQHVKPGKGGAFVRTTLKNVLSGKVVDRTFNAGTKVETATVDKRDDDLPVPRGRRLRLHGLRHLRADARAGRDGRRRRRTTCWRTPRRWSRCTRARRCTSSCRPSVELVITYTDPACRATGPPAAPSRPRWRPARDPGAAVRHHRREDQGRHPRRPLPRPRLTAERPSIDGRPQQGPQARPGRALRGRPARAPIRCTTAGRADRPGPTRRSPDYAVELVEGVAGAPRRDRRAARELLRGLDAGADAARWTGRCCGSALYELLCATTCRTRWRSTRRSSWPSRCPPTSRRASSTACSAGSPELRDPLPSRSAAAPDAARPPAR